MVDTNDADEIAIQSDRQSNQIQDELDYEDDLPPETTSNFPQSDLIAADSSNADAEMEEGEVEDEQALTSSSVTPRKLCYFYKIGKCTWGRQCKFLHPSINDTGAYQLIPDPTESPSNDTLPSTNENDVSNTKPEENHQEPPSLWTPDSVFPRTAAESSWEEGLKQARQMRERAELRRREDKNFAEKRLRLRSNVTGESSAVEDPDEESLILQNIHDKTKQLMEVEAQAIDHDMSVCPNTVQMSDPADFDVRHFSLYEFKQHSPRGYLSYKHSEATRRRNFRSDYKRFNNSYGTDTEWHDPWSRRQSFRHKRLPTSESSSSVSRSSSSRSVSTSLSESSYSRSDSSRSSIKRYHRRRRSPSVKRSRPPSPVPVSTIKSVVVPFVPTATKQTMKTKSSPSNKMTEIQRFKPGRQISSHTFKKAKREGKLEASKFSSEDDDYESSRLTSHDSSPLSFSSTESSSICSSEEDNSVPTTIGAQAAATRLANSKLRNKQNGDGSRNPELTIGTPAAHCSLDKNADSIEKEKSTNSTLESTQNTQSTTDHRQRTNDQKMELLKQLQEIEEEIARKRRNKQK